MTPNGSADRPSGIAGLAGEALLQRHRLLLTRMTISQMTNRALFVALNVLAALFLGTNITLRLVLLFIGGLLAMLWYYERLILGRQLYQLEQSLYRAEGGLVEDVFIQARSPLPYPWLPQSFMQFEPIAWLAILLAVALRASLLT